MNPGTLYFFSNTVPIEESGSFVIFRRHLLPLVEAGWQLKIFSYFPRPAEDIFWEHVRLTRRRWWWPPVRATSPASQHVRARLVLRELRREGSLDGRTPRVLLANLWDSQALFAAALARRKFARLGVFLHDDEIAWQHGAVPHRHLTWFRETVTSAADRIWAVSERLARSLPTPQRAHCRVLHPIAGLPSCRAAWKPRFAEGTHLGYAGKIYPGMVPVLERLAQQLARSNARMTIVTTPAIAERPPLRSERIEWRPFFPRPVDATAWLVEHCSALLVVHPSHVASLEPGWQMLQSSFPSKLTEFAQLGLPIFVIAARDSALGDWAEAHPEIPHFTEPDDPALAETLKALREQSRWHAAAAAVRQLAEGEFNPERNQSTFVSDLERLIA